MVKELKAIFIFSFPGVFLFALFDLIGVDPNQLWGVGYVSVTLLAIVLLLWAFYTYYNLHQKGGKSNMKATEKKYAKLINGIHQALFTCILGLVVIKALTPLASAAMVGVITWGVFSIMMVRALFLKKLIAHYELNGVAH